MLGNLTGIHSAKKNYLNWGIYERVNIEAKNNDCISLRFKKIYMNSVYITRNSLKHFRPPREAVSSSVVMLASNIHLYSGHFNSAKMIIK